MIPFTDEERSKIEKCVTQIKNYCNSEYISKLRTNDYIRVSGTYGCFYMNDYGRIAYSFGEDTIYLGEITTSNPSIRIWLSAQLIEMWPEIKEAIEIEFESKYHILDVINNFTV